MNRRLIFRAWDTEKKEWYKTELPFYGFSLMGECMLVCPPRIKDLWKIEITQYTGLKDKYENEIYEGDIVRVDNYENNTITKCIFDKGQFYLIDNAGGHWNRQLYNQPERLSIIGNIYQDIELFQ